MTANAPIQQTAVTSDPSLAPQHAQPGAAAAWHAQRPSRSPRSVVLVLGLLLLAAVFAIPQPPQLQAADPPATEKRESLRDDASLRSICFIDAKQGWAVGDRGVIWYTPDGGEHWLAQDSGVGCRLDCVQFIDPQQGWAAGGWYESDTQISRGVLLQTQDGGKTWERLENELPRIRQLQFTSRRTAIAAGDWSPVHLGSVFITYDAGRSWQPVPRSESQAIRSIAMAGGAMLTLDRSGMLFRSDRPEAPTDPVFSDRRMQCITATANEQWLAGHEGAVAFSRDAGRSWRPLNRQATTVDISRYDFRCLASDGGQVWMAGVPGDKIFRKTAQNEIVAVGSGITAPIHDLHFLDDQKGWAACGMGTILHTADGGLTWQTQRGGPRRAAALFVSRRARDLAWSMIVATSLEHGYRSMAVIHESEGERSSDPLKNSTAELVLQGVSDVGGCELLAIVESADRQAYRAAIAQSLETAQPAVVVLGDDLTAEQRSAWLQSATASPTVARVFHVHAGERGDVVVHPSAILPAAGVVVGEAWAEALSVVSPGQSQADVMVADRLLDREASVQSIESLLHRLPIGAGGLSRRLPPHGSRSQLAGLQPRTRHGEWIQHLIDACSVADDAKELFASRLKQLTAQIRPSDRPRFMRRLVLQCHQHGEPALYREALRETAALVPESSIGHWADLMLASIDASEEWTRLPQGLSRSASLAQRTKRASPVAYGSPFEQTQPVVLASSSEDQSKRTIRETETPDLIWRQQPIRLISQVGVLGEAASPALISGLERLSAALSAGPWQTLARDQLAAQQGTRQSAGVRAVFSTNRPVLDGRLDETFWGPAGPKDSSTPLRVGYDADYIYIAIPDGFPGTEPTEPASLRQRDADLDQVQRLSLQIDVDRDLLTTYQLEIDRSGRCRDTCNGFAQWQPMWFVKTTDHDGQWNAELAIRRKDLCSLPVAPGDVWFVRLKTLQPNEVADSPISCSPTGWQALAFE
ncbi:Ycf48-like protein precursor [Rosistilla ulvae]|uniref:Ycf48-like protein n=1 Tax=Rosistilla ulvae TaxID=1930277 RepID=A0A517LYY4_9BACT|nr:YCF48-related protein [Rosistilla ulvae]QDS87832.1 Ycf48-like protein precursor [Rosistilla ulvae]